ncbi:serine/threonine-protein kinase [Bacillus mojavensis]|uniref:serine/threonine-protein kinase n=1 Tax=Bacillus mojavensis TaxID=72360 RepID=UPI002DB5FCEA|nr:serine/threonine-protein kinase [Bacillus mojavensis]MEC1681594.1 serine/threonine-protein kinase [Bacillus mojavensis]MEC1711480.1 serine/threonine-protein kinase [Bacillus mojavensis]
MDKIGSGAFAEVKAEINEKGDEVAIKRILEEYKDNEHYTHRFKKEVEMLKKLSGHPNIVPLVEERINEDKQEYAYVMKRARCNLKEFILEPSIELTDDIKISLFDQIVEALVFAHSKDVLHRDLSPNNILITDNFTVWIADFGLGKDYDARSIGGKSSIAGHGTSAYVAPEQLKKLSNATKKSDVYSLGRLLYFILTGEEPDVINSIDRFETLIKRASSYYPDQRYKDAIDFKEAYEKAKQIQSILGQDDKFNLTLGELLNSNPKVPWNEFHEIAMKCNVIEHDWYDFIEPAMEKLKDMNVIYEYVEQIGEDAALSFIKLFRERLSEMPSFGWPYSDDYRIGIFAENFYIGSHLYSSIRKEALELLWDWAAIEDRWKIQDRVISFIEGNKIQDKSLADHFAYYMLETGRTFRKLNTLNTRLIKQDSIKRAVISLQSNS